MRTIPIDDLVIGQWVTLPESTGTSIPKENRITIQIGEGSGETEGDHQGKSTGQTDTTAIAVAAGTPLRVLAMSLPFVYVAVLEGNGEESGPVILDMRLADLAEIDESVPKAVKRFARGRMR
jgi:hypothetical protein